MSRYVFSPISPRARRSSRRRSSSSLSMERTSGSTVGPRSEPRVSEQVHLQGLRNLGRYGHAHRSHLSHLGHMHIVGDIYKSVNMKFEPIPNGVECAHFRVEKVQSQRECRNRKTPLRAAWTRTTSRSSKSSHRRPVGGFSRS